MTESWTSERNTSPKTAGGTTSEGREGVRKFQCDRVGLLSTMQLVEATFLYSRLRGVAGASSAAVLRKLRGELAQMTAKEPLP